MSGPDAPFVVGQLAYVSSYADEVWCAGWSLLNSVGWNVAVLKGVAIDDAASIGTAGQSA